MSNLPQAYFDLVETGRRANLPRQPVAGHHNLADRPAGGRIEKAADRAADGVSIPIVTVAIGQVKGQAEIFR